MNVRQYTIRPYREGDEFGIIKLFKVVFQKDYDIARWNWLYRDNPVGIKTIMVAENHQGEIIAHYAVCPIRIIIDKEQKLGTVSLDTMVHPEYQGLGLFTKLASRLYESIASQGMILTYGFPNKNSFHGFTKKLFWSDLTDNLQIYVRVLRVDRFLQNHLKPQILSSLGCPIAKNVIGAFNRIKKVEKPKVFKSLHCDNISDNIDELWNRTISNTHISVIRNKDYLTWRYLQNPGDKYHVINTYDKQTLVGCAILKILERFGLKIGFIAEILTDPSKPESINELLLESMSYYEEQGVDMVACLSLEKMTLNARLKKNGFIRVPKIAYPQDFHFCILAHDNKEYITNSDNWIISWGDNDVI